MPKNGSGLLFRRKPKQVPNFHIEGKGNRNKFRTSISKVKEAETSSGLPYRRQGNPKQVPDFHIEGKGIRNRVPDSYIEDKGSRKLGLPYEGFPIRRQGNPKTNSGLPYRR
ncbi:unnamed protein product [Rhizophagus irregularis]|nr:unnamed protein product [Rhizophagus irregularis]